MSTEQFGNFAQTTLNGAITSGATSLMAASASGFPSAAQYRVLIDSELMIVTGGAGTTTWTVTRGAEGTSAASHSSGAAVTLVLTAGGLDNALFTALKGYICGLQLAWKDSTHITVNTGQAIDSTAATLISLGSLQTIATSTTGLNGIDATAIAGTVATNSANATVTGTSTAFTTAFNPQSLGTGFSSSSTTLTLPAGFCAQPGPVWPIAVGDLVGNAAKGFYRITAISVWAASGMTATLVSAPGTAFTSGDSLSKIENAQFQAGSQTIRQINSITNDTSLTLSANCSATASGLTASFGVLPANQCALHVWLGTGNSGIGVWLSMQRTTPLGVSGYSSRVRRIGSVVYDPATPTILPFAQASNNNRRRYQFECNRGSHNLTVVNKGGSTSWTKAVMAGLLPSTADIVIGGIGSSDGNNFWVRVSGLGDATTSRPITFQLISQVLCDGNQSIDYAIDAGAGGYIFLGGYEESL